MANPAILRDEVHTLAEACGDAGDEFQSTATRLIKNQRRLSRFFEQNMAAMGPMPAQVSLYMLSVVLRIFRAGRWQNEESDRTRSGCRDEEGSKRCSRPHARR